MAKKAIGKRSFVAGMALFGLVGLSASTVNAVNVDITASILSTLNITQGEDLEFGTIDPHPLGDTITIDASAGAVTTASTLKGSGVTAAKSGTITLQSGSDLNVVLTFAGAPITLTHTNNTDTMTVTDFVDNSQGQAAAPFVHTAGISTINIGGALVVPASAVDGDYSGTVVVTLNYL